MSLEYSNTLFNPTSEKNTPPGALMCLQQSQKQVRHFIVAAKNSGMSFDEAERNVWEMVKNVGFVVMELLPIFRATAIWADKLRLRMTPYWNEALPSLSRLFDRFLDTITSKNSLTARVANAW